MKGFFDKTHVYVNDVEVPHSPVDPPVRVRIVQPMPPLPKVELAPFTTEPRCAQCQSRKVAFAFWPRFHGDCAIPLRVIFPTYPGRYGLGVPSDHEMADYNREVAEGERVRDTVPPHHDLTCSRCNHRWAIAVADDES